MGSKNVYAILNGKMVVPVNDVIEYGLWMAANPRHVALAEVGDVRVSTVFLGLNHKMFGNKDLWFETMIFGGEHCGYQDRYETWDEAEAGHARALALVNGLN